MRKVKKIIARVFILIACTIIVFVPMAVSAIKVGSKRDDIYKQLEQAARINVVMNTLIKCMGSRAGNTTAAITGSQVKKGDVFAHNWVASTTITTSRWIENLVDGGDDGQIWCQEGSDGSNGTIINIAAEYLGVSVTDLVCNGGTGRIFQRATYEIDPYSGYGSYTADDKNCSSVNDTAAAYLPKGSDDQAKQAIRDYYTAWRESHKAENPYLPEASMIGYFNNVDGYFNYLLDYDAAGCDDDGATLKKDRESNTDYYPISRFDKEDKKLTVKRRYYHVTSNKTWTGSISSENIVTSCTGLLGRIEALKSTSNGIADGRGGYEDIMVDALEQACAAAHTAEGDNAWDELKRQLQEVIDNPNVPDETKAEAQANLDKANQITASGRYVVESGDEDDDDGLIYECATVDGLTIDVDDYSYDGEDLDGIIDNTESEKNCYTNAGSLGWIVCPIIDGLGKFIQDMYVKIFEPALRLDVNLFSDSSDTLAAWNDFRSIGNIAFVIFFIFVIFSQLTGIGLDNYGIKKVLPKLIVSAILINLSFIICQIAVDVANIVGASLGQFLSRFPSQTVSEITVEGVSTPSSAWESFSSGLGTNVAIVAIVSAVTAIAVLSQGLAIIIPVIMFLITVVVSVLGTLVLLGIRQALAVILVVFSPLAFVCYMLPNTKSIFDKWYKMFKGLLLAYPISSALIYGGNMVSHILLNSANGNTWVVISAGVIAVAPIFFLPKAIQSSMGAIGNMVGHWTNRASGWGKATAGRRLEQNALITRRRDYNRMAREQKHHAKIGAYNATRSQKVLKKLGGKDIASMSKTQMAQYRAAQGMVDSENKSRQDVYASRFSKMDQAGLEKEFAGMANSDKLDAQMVSAAIDSLGAMDQGKMMDAVSKLSESEGWANMSQEDRSHIAATLGSQNGNAAAKAYSKILNSTPNGQKPARFRDALKDGSIASKIRDMDADTLASQDKDALDFISRTQYSDKTGGPSRSLINAFSDEQVRTAMVKSDGQSAKAQNLQSSLAQRDNLDQVIDNMNDEQVSQLSFDTVAGAAKTSKNSRKIWNSAFSRARAANNNPNFQGKVDKRFINGNGGSNSGGNRGGGNA